MISYLNVTYKMKNILFLIPFLCLSANFFFGQNKQKIVWSDEFNGK
jgi:hypothetical protein